MGGSIREDDLGGWLSDLFLFCLFIAHGTQSASRGMLGALVRGQPSDRFVFVLYGSIYDSALSIMPPSGPFMV